MENTLTIRQPLLHIHEGGFYSEGDTLANWQPVRSVWIPSVHNQVMLHTLNSSSGIASAKRLASSLISTSSSKGMELYLRFGKGRFCCDVSLGDEDELAALAALNGKKHLKIPSAWNFVACVKFTQTSIRPGRLRAGSKRSIWFVVANRSLQKK